MLEFATGMASATKNRQKYGMDYFLEQTKTRQNHQQRFHVVSRFDALFLCVLSQLHFTFLDHKEDKRKSKTESHQNCHSCLNYKLINQIISLICI